MTTIRVLQICHASATLGLGHLKRLIALSKALKQQGDIEIKFLVFGDSLNSSELTIFNPDFKLISAKFKQVVTRTAKDFNPSVVIFDLHPEYIDPEIGKLFSWLKERKASLFSIDSLIEYRHLLDFCWIPSFHFDSTDIKDEREKIKFGWDSFLIQKNLPNPDWISGWRVTVLTGGSDIKGLGKILPSQLDDVLDKRTQLHWVQGPYSEKPNLPDNPRLSWTIHHAPNQLDKLITASNYVVTTFGVSFFEVLQYGIPSVVFSPYGDEDKDELKALSKHEVALVCFEVESVVQSLLKLMDNDKLAAKYSANSKMKLSINGCKKLAQKILMVSGV